jgi:hypothetical protein
MGEGGDALMGPYFFHVPNVWWLRAMFRVADAIDWIRGRRE